ncbi:hypothetical protein DUI87_31729 [Hirundo rustica rustica]|uniref:ribonuclease H n=1 Tax=Hirundo rustica rustica TaxID=333673 RepID=A0A3M0ISM3_HIRRU|nr:hypothetical protein DUI87_31729 [Hirundo rustica rustica]
MSVSGYRSRGRNASCCHEETVSASTQTVTEEKGTKTRATVSVSTQAVTEEKETKGAISTSTQTVTEAEQPKPVAVAPVQKKSKSKSVRIVTDEDVAGPSHPAEETEPEIITRSLSLGELRDLRREFTRQTNESILTWLLRIWDAAANDTILDGSEARQLGSLSRDVVIDQGIGRTQKTLSLWRQLLTSVRDRYLCKEDLQVHQGKWSTMEQGTRCLRELAVLEIIFSEDERFPKSPDDVQCTSQMWLRFARLGPEMYSRYLATLQWREGEDKVGVLVNKLRIYEDTVTAAFRTHVSSVETRLAEQVRSLIEERHQKLKKELKEEIYHISPEPTRVSAIRSRYLPARERGYTPRGNLWSFLREHGEDMRKWDGKPTSSLAARVRELKRETPTTKSSSRANTAPVSQTQNSRQYRKDDMTDPLEGTSGTYLGICSLRKRATCSMTRNRGALPLASPIWPVRKSSGEWRLTVDYRALNEVTPPLSAAVPDMLELQYELESKAAKWYATIDIANAFFSIPLAAECRAQFAFTWKGVQYTWNRLPQGWKHSPTICHGLIQTALEKGEAPEHLQYIDDIIVWGNTAGEVFEKGEEIIQILLKAGFAIKRSKVKGRAQEIQFLGVKWQDGHRQVPTEVINKITAMSPPTNKKETQAFLGAIGFWRTHIPAYRQIVSPLYLVTRKKNDFHWGPEQQQAFAQIEQEIAHAVALGPVRMGPGVKNVFHSAARNKGETFGLPEEEEEEEQVTCAKEAPPYNELPETERQYALFTDGSCQIVAELKAIQLALDIAEREKWPRLYLYTDSWMVANALWGWLNRWKKANWQRRGKPIWAAEIWQDIAARVEKLTVNIRHVDAHVSRSWANEEHHNNEQVDKVKVSQVDLDWQHKGEVFLARWAHDASGHQGRDATYRWARDRGVDLTMDNISQVIHNCET